jgi:hypothetical protein
VESYVHARLTSVRGSVAAYCSAFDYSYELSIMHRCKREFGAIVKVSDNCTCNICEYKRSLFCQACLIATI